METKLKILFSLKAVEKKNYRLQQLLMLMLRNANDKKANSK